MSLQGSTLDNKPKICTVENVMHAGRGERCFLVDRFDAGGGVGAGNQRHMLHVGQVNVGDELPFAGDEAAILPYAAIGGDIAVVAGAHLRSSSGRLSPRIRSAASAIASTICA